MYFEEFHRFGLNWFTASSITLIILIAFQMKALYNQGASIWEKKSGESVSISYFLYTLFLNGLALFYGLKVKSLAIFLTGFTTIFFIWIVVGLWKFNKPSKAHYTILGIGTAGALLLPWLPIGVVYAMAMIGTFIPITSQIRELYTKKNPGLLEVSYFLVLDIKTTVWLVYVFALGDILLQTYSTIMFVLVNTIVLMWVKYHPQGKTALKQQVTSILPI